MYVEHRVFVPPDDPDAVIWRYMDLTKFVLLLERRALRFARADQLGDPHEGTLPDAAVAVRDAFDEEIGANKPGWWAPGIDSAEGKTKIELKIAFVCCWNLSEYENAALWDVYGKGVAIRSSFTALRESLLCDDDVYIGRVHYIDYRRDAIPLDNALYPLVYKRRYFEHERELRAIITGQTITDEPEFKWTGDPRLGIDAAVDLNTLVQKVYVAPGEPLLHEAVTALCARYGLDPPEQSSLDEPPRY